MSESESKAKLTTVTLISDGLHILTTPLHISARTCSECGVKSDFAPAKPPVLRAGCGHVICRSCASKLDPNSRCKLKGCIHPEGLTAAGGQQAVAFGVLHLLNQSSCGSSDDFDDFDDMDESPRIDDEGNAESKKSSESNARRRECVICEGEDKRRAAKACHDCDKIKYMCYIHGLEHVKHTSHGLLDIRKSNALLSGKLASDGLCNAASKHIKAKEGTFVDLSCMTLLCNDCYADVDHSKCRTYRLSEAMKNGCLSELSIMLSDALFGEIGHKRGEKEDSGLLGAKEGLKLKALPQRLTPMALVEAGIQLNVLARELEQAAKEAEHSKQEARVKYALLKKHLFSAIETAINEQILESDNAFDTLYASATTIGGQAKVLDATLTKATKTLGIDLEQLQIASHREGIGGIISASGSMSDMSPNVGLSNEESKGGGTNVDISTKRRTGVVENAVAELDNARRIGEALEAIQSLKGVKMILGRNRELLDAKAKGIHRVVEAVSREYRACIEGKASEDIKLVAALKKVTMMKDRAQAVKRQASLSDGGSTNGDGGGGDGNSADGDAECMTSMASRLVGEMLITTGIPVAFNGLKALGQSKGLLNEVSPMLENITKKEKAASLIQKQTKAIEAHKYKVVALAEGEPVDLQAEGFTPNFLSVNPAGDLVAVGSTNGIVKIFNIATGAEIPAKPNTRWFGSSSSHSKAVTSISWHPIDNSVFISSARDCIVKEWRGTREKSNPEVVTEYAIYDTLLNLRLGTSIVEGPGVISYSQFNYDGSLIACRVEDSAQIHLYSFPNPRKVASISCQHSFHWHLTMNKIASKMRSKYVVFHLIESDNNGKLEGIADELPITDAILGSRQGLDSPYTLTWAGESLLVCGQSLYLWKPFPKDTLSQPISALKSSLSVYYMAAKIRVANPLRVVSLQGGNYAAVRDADGDVFISLDESKGIPAVGVQGCEYVPSCTGVYQGILGCVTRNDKVLVINHAGGHSVRLTKVKLETKEKSNDGG